MGSSGHYSLSPPPTWNKSTNKCKMQMTSLTPAISRSLPQLWFDGFKVSGWKCGKTFEENCFRSRNYTAESARDWLIQIRAFRKEKNILQETIEKDESVLELPLMLIFSDPVDVQLVHVWHCWPLPILFLHLARPHPACYRVAPKVPFPLLHFHFQHTRLPIYEKSTETRREEV